MRPCTWLFLPTWDCEDSASQYLLIARKAGAATGVWIEEYEMAHVPTHLCSGHWFQNIGVGAPSGYWLLPEEALFMMSAGRMELLDEGGLEMTLLGAWGACIDPAGGVNKYLVTAFWNNSNKDLFSLETSWL